MGFPTGTSDRLALNTNKLTNLPDNTTRLISPAKHRTVVEDLINSCLNLNDDQEFLVPEGGALQEVLIKTSNIDHQTDWSDVTGITSFQNYISQYVATNAPSPNNASDIIKGISERATFAEVSGGTRNGNTGAELFVSPPELTTYVQNYVSTYVTNNTPQIAASAETTLNNAGDFFDFDTSTLTPPVSGRKIIPVVLEKGTAGGELAAQELQFDFDFGNATINKFINIVNTDGEFAYLVPDFDNRLFKINKTTKTVIQLNDLVPGGAGPTVRKYGSGIYDPNTKKVFLASILAGNVGVIDTKTDNFYSFGSNIGLLVRSDNGDIYGFLAGTTATPQVSKFTPDSSGTSEAITLVNAGTVTPSSFFRGAVVYNNVAYLFPTQGLGIANMLNQITVYDFNTETFLTPIPLNSSTWGNPQLVGSNVYVAGDVSGFGTNLQVLKLDLLTNTVSYQATTQQGYSGSVYVPETNQVFFIPREPATSGFLRYNVGDDTFDTFLTLSGLPNAIYENGSLICPPDSTLRRAFEIDILPPFSISPANPAPFFSASNIFDTSGNVNKVASLEDYDLDITEDGSGNITNIRVTMLTEGTKNVTLNLVYSGF